MCGIDLAYYYNHEAEQWIEGPNLIQGRRYHAAGVLFDRYTLQKIVIVTGGGYRESSIDILFDSTEMLMANQWASGKKHTLLMFTGSLQEVYRDLWVQGFSDYRDCR